MYFESRGIHLNKGCTGLELPCEGYRIKRKATKRGRFNVTHLALYALMVLRLDLKIGCSASNGPLTLGHDNS